MDSFFFLEIKINPMVVLIRKKNMFDVLRWVGNHTGQT